MKTLQDLIYFLDQLHGKKINFHLDKIRDSILIELTIPNQMWEIEFMEDGTIEIEKFISTGDKLDRIALDTLISEFAETEGDDHDERSLKACDKDVFGFLKALDQAKIFYTLDRDKNNESIIILAVVPGQRWRVAYSSDGSLKAEKFLSSTDIFDEKEIGFLFKLIEESM